MSRVIPWIAGAFALSFGATAFGGALPDCNIDFEISCPDAAPVCGASYSGGNSCLVEGLLFCYSSGLFSYKVTPASPLTITLSGDLNRLELFFAHQGAASGEMRFFDAVVGGNEVDAPLTTNGDCLAFMPPLQSVTFSTPVRRIEVTASGGAFTAVWIDDFHVNPTVEPPVCDVAADDLSCTPIMCPVPPPDEFCVPDEVIINQAGEVIRVVSCDCLPDGPCGIRIDPAGIATCAGPCPAPLFCKPVVVDLGDGTSTLFCECRPSTCTCGDIDQSGGNVNLIDFAHYLLCHNTNNPNPPDCDAKEFACSDLTGNGTINFLDFATFALYFNASTTKTPPDCAGGP